MNKYESMVIFTPDLTEEEVKKENQKIADLVGKLKGSIAQTDYLGKRTLAYDIAKKREGHYIVNYLTLPPEETGKLERHYALAENILRYNFLKFDKRSRTSLTRQASLPNREDEPRRDRTPSLSDEPRRDSNQSMDAQNTQGKDVQSTSDSNNE